MTQHKGDLQFNNKTKNSRNHK